MGSLLVMRGMTRMVMMMIKMAKLIKPNQTRTTLPNQQPVPLSQLPLIVRNQPKPQRNMGMGIIFPQHREGQRLGIKRTNQVSKVVKMVQNPNPKKNHPSANPNPLPNPKSHPVPAPCLINNQANITLPVHIYQCILLRGLGMMI